MNAIVKRIVMSPPTGLVTKGLIAHYKFDDWRNLFKYSEAFDNALWLKQTVTVTTGQADPFGGATACKLTSTGINGYMEQRLTSCLANTNYVLSFNMWADAPTTVSVVITDSTGGNVIASLEINATTDKNRYILNFNSGIYTSIRIFLPGAPSFSTDEVIYLWGAHLQLASVTPDAYQLTTDGQTLTDSVGGYNGTLGSTAAADVNDPTPDGKGLSYTTNDYNTIGGDDTFKGLTQGSIEMVFTASNLDASRAIFCVGPKTATSYGLFAWIYITTAGAITIQQRNADNTTNNLLAYTADGVITVGNIYHIVYDVGSGGNALYVNGLPIALTYDAGSAASNFFFDDVNTTQNYWFGAWKYNNSLSLFHEGIIYDGMIYNRHRVAAEISQNYHYLKSILKKERGIDLAS